MKRSFPYLLLFLLIQHITPQARYSLVLDKSYEELGFSPRITHSGIYAVSSFDVAGGTIYLRDFDAPMMTVVNGERISRQAAVQPFTRDIAVGFPDGAVNGSIRRQQATQADGSTLLKKSYAGGRRSLFADDGGVSVASADERIVVRVKERRSLVVTTERSAARREFTFPFPGDLAYADLIGIDTKGNMAIVVERYRSEIPLHVQRYVYTATSEGNVLSILAVPMKKYCTTVREFQIDETGALYHLMTSGAGVTMLRWEGLSSPADDTLRYPEDYSAVEHYNFHLTADEPFEEQTSSPLAAGDRPYALRLGEEYVRHLYTCTNANLAPANVTAPDGDIVRTPAWLIAGTNARVAYKWGGFSTLAQYDDGLKGGKFAGDINTSGVSSSAVGVDCSGFVSRCWGLTYHSSTANMPGITTQYASWDDLKPGDAIHKVGHVRLFVEKMPNGSLRIAEASGRDWATTYWSYAPSDLEGVYTPRYYNGMVGEYSVQRPELLSAAVHSDSTAVVTWRCDTANVLGYRLYGSNDGKQWSLLLNETALTDTFAVTPLRNAGRSYRVASVLRGTAAESDWSNVLSAGNIPNTPRFLIVDGFEKNTGSWRGAEHAFIARYANALSRKGVSFESVKNSQLESSRFALSGYFSAFWMLGDESTDGETFSAPEQSLVKEYLEHGGRIFASGSEIGWDLSFKGSADDKNFYASYLKASYTSDDAGGTSVKGINFLPFTKCEFTIGQTYDEDYPDEIDTAGGSILCFRYNNLKGAGIQYSGTFGSSSTAGKVIYLAFPLETTASDSSFNAVIDGAMEFFDPLSPVGRSNEPLAQHFELMQNYPNPFNPVTTIRFAVGTPGAVSLTVYDVLGRMVATLVDGTLAPGEHSVPFDASHLSSGVYCYRLASRGNAATKKMLLLR